MVEHRATAYLLLKLIVFIRRTATVHSLNII
jgi:hypothetical protein